MSADNGIYVLKTRGINGEFEYRVREVHNIESIYAPGNAKIPDTEVLVSTFGQVEVFTDDLTAFTIANDLLFDIEQDGDKVEYGVLMIEFDLSFPDTIGVRC
jgi:hypothetical protein